MSEQAWLDEMERLRGRDLERRLRVMDSPAGPMLECDGRSLLNLASNNYLGLANNSRVVAAAQEALQRWGVGAGAARLVSGHTRAHADLEAALVSFKQTEAALVFSSGYAANVGLIAALAGPRDLILADTLNHASLNDGCRLSRARLRFYRHGDPEHLEYLLDRQASGGQLLIVTDAIFSMDGSFGPLAAVAKLAERHRALLIVDDAHGSGVIGPQGRGTLHQLDLADQVPIQVGTLSKAFGVQGGFVAGSRALIELLIHRARSFVFSTALAPALAVAALAALDIAQQEDWRRQQMHERLSRLVQALIDKGYDLRHQLGAPMAAVMLGSSRRALTLADELELAGVFAPAIRPPTVPADTARIRLTVMATHTSEQINQAIAAFPPAGTLAL